MSNVGASSTSAFLAVDLDAVLDDFESEEEATRREKQKQQQQLTVNLGGHNGGGDHGDIVNEEQHEQQQQEEAKDLVVSRLKSKQEDRETLFRERLAASGDMCDNEVSALVPEEEPDESQITEPPEEDAECNVQEDSAAAPDDHFHQTTLESGALLEQEKDMLTSCVSPKSASTSSSPTFESIYDTSATVADNDNDVSGGIVDSSEASGIMPESASSNSNVRGGARPKEGAAASASVPTESPPPYSEVDPMSGTAVNSATSSVAAVLSSPVRAAASNLQAVAEEEPQSGSNAGSPQLQLPFEIDALLSGLTEDQLMLGKVSPHWVPDMEAPHCMICDGKFTIVRRRHHCRACGKVLCSACCNDKVILSCIGNKIARVCKPCKLILDRLHTVEMQASRANPHSPSIESSASSTPVTTPVVGVLKRLGDASSAPEGGAAAGAEHRGEAKQVMFSDGIRPGGDLAELDGSAEQSSSRSSSSSSSRRRRSRKAHKSSADVGRSLIPPEEDALPLLWGDRTKRTPEELADLVVTGRDGPVAFQINRNLKVFVSLANYSPIMQHLWCYRSEGLASVGQDEIVLLVLRLPNETLLHKDIFEHFQTLYEQARAGHPAIDMSYSSILSGKPFLGSTEYGGFLYIRHSFQSLEGLDVPAEPPFLFALLLTKWEVPWARVFPLRLKLRLGAEMRYYPAPIWSVRGRKTVYKETGNTILKLLCDFKNYAYSVPIIRGMLIQMELKLTTILLPKDRYRQIERALLNSNEPVLALGASFSTTADSHLVAVQNDDESLAHNGGVSYSDYETQAINIMNKTRKVTGASFVIFNGALKAASGLSAKSSIVEDGIMVQVTPEKMTELRKALEKMEDFQIKCGPLGEESPDEIVAIKWVQKNSSLNSGIRSLIDDTCLNSVSSIRLHAGRDYVSEEENLFVRWTEVFLLANPTESHEFDPPDPMVAATLLAKAICTALVSHLKMLKESQVTKLAVRVTLEQDKAGYDTGIHGQQFGTDLMNALDSVLVPIIHGDISSQKLCLELVFHILEL